MSNLEGFFNNESGWRDYDIVFNLKIEDIQKMFNDDDDKEIQYKLNMIKQKEMSQYDFFDFLKVLQHIFKKFIEKLKSEK